MTRVLAALPVEDEAPVRQDLSLELAVAAVRGAGFETELAVISPGQAGVLNHVLTARPSGLVYLHIATRKAWQCLGKIFPLLAAHAPRPLFIAGGLFASEHAQPLLTALRDLDAVISGEIEATLVAVAEAVQAGRAWQDEPGLWLGRNGTVRQNPPRPPIPDLDSLPMAALDLLHAENSPSLSRKILTGRGCDSNCSYCSLQVPYREAFPDRQRFWRSRSPRNIVDEMELLQRRWGIHRFELNTWVFFGYGAEGTTHVEGITREILSRGMRVRFSFVTHPGHLTQNLHLLPLLQEAGLDLIHLGIDSILDRARSLYGLPFAKHDILCSLEALHRQSIPFRTAYLFYDPYTALSEIGETLAFLRSIRPLYSHLQSPFSSILHHQILNTVLRLTARLPILERLRSDGLLVREGSLDSVPQARFRDVTVGRFFNLHRRFNVEILRNVAPLAFHPVLEQLFSNLSFFLLDVLEALRLRLATDPEADGDEVLFDLRHLVRETLAPAWVASRKPDFPPFERRELVEGFFLEEKSSR